MKLVGRIYSYIAKYNNFVFFFAKNLGVSQEATLESLDLFKNKLIWLAVIL